MNMGYNNDTLSASVGYGKNGYSASASIHTTDNKFQIGANINNNNFDASLNYKASDKLNITASGNKDGVNVGVKIKI